MKAGQSVAQSLSAVTDNADPPVSDEFALARREIELGASVDSALNNMVKRIGSNDLRLMVMVITIQRSVGGDLPAILATLADTMRQRQEIGLGQSAVALQLEKPFLQRLFGPARRWLDRQTMRMTPEAQAANFRRQLDFVGNPLGLDPAGLQTLRIAAAAGLGAIGTAV